MPRLVRRSLLLAAALLAAGVPAHAHAQASAPAAAPRDSVKIALVRRLLDRVGAADQSIAAMEASIPAQRAANPRIPAVFWERFMKEARARHGELVEMFVAVYDRHFTTDELRQLLAFYDTPVGRKLIAEQPAVMRESMLAGQAWGQRIGAAVGAQLEAEGISAP